MHGANHAVGPHGIDDILCVGSGARIVVDLRADRKPHALAHAFGDDRGVRDVDAGRFGRTVQIAGFGELERAANGLTAPGSSNVR